MSNLRDRHPELMNEWDYGKNLGLDPAMLRPGSGKKAWWICTGGHSYEAVINKRTTRGNACPFCSGHRVCPDNCLKMLRPELADEWDHVANGDKMPSDITLGSDCKAHWVCSKQHRWIAKVSQRTKGQGQCPECSGLKESYPHLMDEWDFEKNKELDPRVVKPGSDKRVLPRSTDGFKTAENFRS